MKKERIDRILSGTGRFSRAEARTVIQKGLVTVDGAVVRDPGAKIERSCAVAVRDKAVDTSEFVYYMLNKPAGYVSASEPEGCYRICSRTSFAAAVCNARGDSTRM